MTTKPRLCMAHPQLTFLPDPPWDPDAMLQIRHIARAIVTLDAYFQYYRRRDDVLVSGQGYLCRRPGEARRSPYPDLMVAIGVPISPEAIAREGNGYTISEIGQPPDFVMEVASRTTARQDYERKPAQYAALGVPEYWRFDYSGRGLYPTPLAGERLVDGEYRPIEVTRDAAGVLQGYSEALQLELHVVSLQLRFYDPVAEMYVQDMMDAWEYPDDAEARSAINLTYAAAALSERDARIAAEARANAERDARIAAEERIRQLEAEAPKGPTPDP